MLDIQTVAGLPVKFSQDFPALISHLMKTANPRVLPGEDIHEVTGRRRGNGEESILTPQRKGLMGRALKEELPPQARWVHSKPHFQLGNDSDWLGTRKES